jgi:hypothetical protein
VVDVDQPGVDIVVGCSVVDVVGASVVDVAVVGGASQPDTQNTCASRRRPASRRR